MYDKHADKNDGIPPNKTPTQVRSTYQEDAEVMPLTRATNMWLITNPVNGSRYEVYIHYKIIL